MCSLEYESIIKYSNETLLRVKSDPVNKDRIMISTNQPGPEQIKTYCFPDFNPNSNNSYNYFLLTAV